MLCSTGGLSGLKLLVCFPDTDLIRERVFVSIYHYYDNIETYITDVKYIFIIITVNLKNWPHVGHRYSKTYEFDFSRIVCDHLFLSYTPVYFSEIMLNIILSWEQVHLLNHTEIS